MACLCSLIILLRNLDLFISALFQSYQAIDCRQGKSGSVSGCSVVRPSQHLTVTEARGQRPGGVRHYPFSPNGK